MQRTTTGSSSPIRQLTAHYPAGGVQCLHEEQRGSGQEMPSHRPELQTAANRNFSAESLASPAVGISSLFSCHSHPFVWTTPEERAGVMTSVEEPVWHRFLEEAERHFAARGGVCPPSFPVFCQDGDLDEVMAAAVLAYVGNEKKYWQWIAEWLRALIAYYQQVAPTWRENQRRILKGEPSDRGNPRQFFEGFTRSGYYWVEAGLMSSVLHLLDLIEAYSPESLNAREKAAIAGALADFSTRYAFHEESVKYSNRGIWANAALLVAAVVDPDSQRAALLRYQAAQRHQELRSTFFDDGMHGEGSSDYHLMAADGLLCYALLAAHLDGDSKIFTAEDGDGSFFPYPSFLKVVKAYLRTVLPGPVPWNNPRGCSVSVPMPVAPALVQAYRLSGDPEIGWFLRQRLAQIDDARPTPLKVTRAALLGLGKYQPLLNFWLYRPIADIRPPTRTLDILPDHGGLFSRSGWDKEASCVTVRYGYEGTEKGHRDFGHVLVRTGGRTILGDPFPRSGPKGLDSSLFHNTITLDGVEPHAVLGSLKDHSSVENAEAFLISNSGGSLPARSYLHDPHEGSNYWFTNHPKKPDHVFHRTILHVHHRCVVGIDSVSRAQSTPAISQIDWFFHTPLRPHGYDPEAPERREQYCLQQKNIGTPPQKLALSLRGPSCPVARGQWGEVLVGKPTDGASFRVLPWDDDLCIETGHHALKAHRSQDGIHFDNEIDYFLRCRTKAPRARMVWMVSWDENTPDIEVKAIPLGFIVTVTTSEEIVKLMINWASGKLDLHRSVKGEK